MRTLSRIGIGLGAILALGSAWKNWIHSASQKVLIEKEVPAKLTIEDQDRGEIETYSLERHIQAGNFANFNYQGLFSVEKAPSGRLRISLQLKNHADSTVHFEALLDHEQVQEIRAGKAENEEEEDELNILKDFVSLIAYRSTEDTTGKYQAVFTPLDDLLIKKKTAYSSPLIKILDSHHEIHLDPSGKLLSAVGRETCQVQVGSSSSLQTLSEYVLKKIEIRTVAYTRNQTQQKELSLTPLTPIASRSDQFISWSHLEPRLNRLHGLSRPEQLSLFHDLLNTMKKDASSLSSFMNWVDSRLSDSQVRTIAIGVLSSLGNEIAQHTLLTWYQQFPDSRLMILNAFTTTSTPLSGETHAFLTDLSNQKLSQPEASYSAALALGSALQNTNRPDDITQLETLYQNAQNANEQEIYLDAIGNSGNTHFLPVIRDGLSAKNDEVREKAVLAMRLMKNSDINDLLSQAKIDPSLRVKAAALQVLQLQERVL